MRILLTIAAVAALGLCGYAAFQLLTDDDENEISDAIERVGTSADPSYCREDVTTAWLQAATGIDAAFVEEACEQEATIDEARARSVDVADIEVDSNRATATASYDGGSLDGSTVRISLVRNEGRWKLNQFEGFTELDRAGYERGYRSQLRRPAVGFSAEDADCVLAGMREYSDEALADLLTEVPSAFDPLLIECDRLGIERTLVAPFGEPPLEYPEPMVGCVGARVASTSDQDLALLLRDPVAYGTLPLDCDRELVLRGLRTDLIQEGTSPETAECAVADLRAQENVEVARLTADSDAFDDLLADCEA